MSAVDPPRHDLADPALVVDLMELTAVELERRAERLLKLSRDLLAQAAHHASLQALPEERSLGRGGVVVSEKEAIAAAKELGSFGRTEFAAALGLAPSSVSRWLSKLLTREHPIIERSDDGRYAYIDPNRLVLGPERSTRAKRAKGFQAGGVAGTGDDLRSVPKEVRAIVRSAQADGWMLSRQGVGHWQLSRNGRSVGFGSSPTNPGNTAKDLRRQLFSGREHLQRQTSRNGHA